MIDLIYSILPWLLLKSQNLCSKSNSFSSISNIQNESLPASENTSISSIFSNITSLINLVDYDNDDDNINNTQNENDISQFEKDKMNYDYLFFKNCEIFYAEVILIKGYIETVIGKEIRGVM